MACTIVRDLGANLRRNEMIIGTMARTDLGDIDVALNSPVMEGVYGGQEPGGGGDPVVEAGKAAGATAGVAATFGAEVTVAELILAGSVAELLLVSAAAVVMYKAGERIGETIYEANEKNGINDKIVDFGGKVIYRVGCWFGSW